MNEKQLALYIAAKVARLDAMTSAIHAILYKDLEPDDIKAAQKRKWAIQNLYNDNIQAERAHLQTQFPEDYGVLDEYISLGEREIEDRSDEAIRDVMEGRVDIPEAFQEPPGEHPHQENQD